MSRVCIGSTATVPAEVRLVVGAMGVFVFALALRHWLGERRKFRQEAGP
jgi:hypothetical protein